MSEAIISKKRINKTVLVPTLKTEIITSNTNWTVPNHVGNISVMVYGGGSSANYCSSVYIAGIGGDGGFLNNGSFDINEGNVVPITIGRGGRGGLGNKKSSGGSTSFGTYLVANGASSSYCGSSGGGSNSWATQFGVGGAGNTYIYDTRNFYTLYGGGGGGGFEIWGDGAISRCDGSEVGTRSYYCGGGGSTSFVENKRHWGGNKLFTGGAGGIWGGGGAGYYGGNTSNRLNAGNGGGNNKAGNNGKMFNGWLNNQFNGVNTYKRGTNYRAGESRNQVIISGEDNGVNVFIGGGGGGYGGRGGISVLYKDIHPHIDTINEYYSDDDTLQAYFGGGGGGYLSNGGNAFLTGNITYMRNSYYGSSSVYTHKINNYDYLTNEFNGFRLGFSGGGGGGYGADGGDCGGGGGGYGISARGGNGLILGSTQWRWDFFTAISYASSYGGGGGYYGRGGDAFMTVDEGFSYGPTAGTMTISLYCGGAGGYGNAATWNSNAGYGAGGIYIENRWNGGNGICIIQYYVTD